MAETKAELDGTYMDIAQLRFALGCVQLPEAEKARMKEQLLAHIKAKGGACASIMSLLCPVLPAFVGMVC